MMGGPFYNVKLGRRDGLVSRASRVEGNLPRPTMAMDQLIDIFTSRGFSVQEMVALSGAHTIGLSHCKEFSSEIYNYSRTSEFDPSFNRRYAEGLRSACVDYHKNPSLSVFNDVMTPRNFDNAYYQNLPRGLGVLKSDRALVMDQRTKPYVELYAKDQKAFFDAFGRAMEKLSLYGVKSGRRGEIRRRRSKSATPARPMIPDCTKECVVGVFDGGGAGAQSAAATIDAARATQMRKTTAIFCTGHRPLSFRKARVEHSCIGDNMPCNLSYISPALNDQLEMLPCGGGGGGVTTGGALLQGGVGVGVGVGVGGGDVVVGELDNGGAVVGELAAGGVLTGGGAPAGGVEIGELAGGVDVGGVEIVGVVVGELGSGGATVGVIAFGGGAGCLEGGEIVGELATGGAVEGVMAGGGGLGECASGGGTVAGVVGTDGAAMVVQGGKPGGVGGG
ncbi:hypothetical protein Ccrd_019198 [Cynara cardunculus var. scolymus]|uniref:peroxidase n=1 Tax=Cynara cardunculus var. scolymus TaxID=59895 RepID=A0A103Y4M4_CYNCS|nr:hypothetical protein Ccrd_019198 [Cynara cardunculus var. scolymus]